MLATLDTEGPGYASARPPKPGVAGSNPAGGTELSGDADDARSAVVDARITRSSAGGPLLTIVAARLPNGRSTRQYCGRRATSRNRSWEESNLGPALAGRRSPAHYGLAAGGDPSLAVTAEGESPSR
jgi:hypothetical protein